MQILNIVSWGNHMSLSSLKHQRQTDLLWHDLLWGRVHFVRCMSGTDPDQTPVHMKGKYRELKCGTHSPCLERSWVFRNTQGCKQKESGGIITKGGQEAQHSNTYLRQIGWAQKKARCSQSSKWCNKSRCRPLPAADANCPALADNYFLLWADYSQSSLSSALTMS